MGALFVRSRAVHALGTRFDGELVGNGRNNKLTGRQGTDRLKDRGNRTSCSEGLQGDILEGGARTNTLRGGRGDDDRSGTDSSSALSAPEP
jgi:hypothetical protein